jgi:hypothetical protein
MTRYRGLWWTTILATFIPGAVVGLLWYPMLGVVVAATVLALWLGTRLLAPAEAHRWPPDLSCGVILLCCSGPVLGRALVPLLLLTMATAPLSVAALRRRIGADTESRGAVAIPERYDVDGCLSALDYEAWCDLWRSSFVRVKAAPTMEERVLMAGLRGSLLDELERRDSGAFNAWLARSPSPASQPSRPVAPSTEPRREDS